MLMLERQKEILAYLSRKKSVTVRVLARHLYVSEATIRRDLSEMEKMGLLSRTHGGAVIFEQTKGEISQFVREQKNTKEKKMLAEAALDFIQSTHTIFLDSSSTVGTIIPALGQYTGLTVVTTGLKNAILLSEHVNGRIYLPGGHIHFSSNSIVGGDTIEYLSHFYPDVAFMSCAGIDASSGITETSFEQAQIKRAVIQNAKAKILMADSSKFEKTCLCRVSGFDGFDYCISDRLPGDPILQRMSVEGCEFIRA